MGQKAHAVENSDKTTKGSPAEVPKFEYQVASGDYRDSQAKISALIANANNFHFHDLNLPSNKDLLEAFGAVSTRVADTGKGGAMLPDGSVLGVEKNAGHLASTILIKPDGGMDVASYDDKAKLKTEVITGPLGSRERQYRPDGTLASEQNVGPGGSYIDKIEFDAKERVTHSHSQSPTDVKDDQVLPDGSGIMSQIHLDSDPKQAFTDVAVTKADGSIKEDKIFGDKNFGHLEVDKNGQVTLIEQSDMVKGVIHRKQRQSNGEMKDFLDFMT